MFRWIAIVCIRGSSSGHASHLNQTQTCLRSMATWSTTYPPSLPSFSLILYNRLSIVLLAQVSTTKLLTLVPHNPLTPKIKILEQNVGFHAWG